MHDRKTSAYKEEWIKMVEHFESRKYIWSRLNFLRHAVKFKAGIAVKPLRTGGDEETENRENTRSRCSRALPTSKSLKMQSKKEF